MSWASWGWERNAAATEFLNSGKLTGAFIPNKCTSSSDCAMGWACINGECKQVNGPGGNNQGWPDPTIPSVPGTLPPSTNSPCGDGPDINRGCSVPGPGGCRTTTCGDGDTRADCCGNRCCRYSYGVGAPTVNCACGDCPDYGDGGSGSGNRKWCVKFCDSYFKTYGERSKVCDQKAACDECQACTGEQGGRSYCENRSEAPCHCNVPDGCYVCENDGTATPVNCDICCSASAQCPGKTYKVTTCVPPGSMSSPCELSFKSAQSWKQQNCPPSNSGDKPLCDGACQDVTLCYPSGSPEDGPPSIIDSHPGSVVNKNYGYIRNDETGEMCWLLNLCNKKDLPAECRECACSSHKDCGECERCDETTCTCVEAPDDSCGNNIRTTWATLLPSFTLCRIVPKPNCGPFDCTKVGGSLVVHGNACGPAPHRLKQTREAKCVTGSVVINECTTKTIQEDTVALYEVYDGNGNKILDFAGNSPCGWAGGAHPSSETAGSATPFILETEPC